ncbi:MAG TPA: carboxypeptidase-like regulatory domain-containing protein, partial [Planctomycetota bacterium]|nr:carboxypeptidase-like regulatory domain-containing protein [Planctomycetota bacterium]
MGDGYTPSRAELSFALAIDWDEESTSFGASSVPENGDPLVSGDEALPKSMRIFGRVLGANDEPIAGARVVWLDGFSRFFKPDLEAYRHDARTFLLEADPSELPGGAPSIERTKHVKAESGADGTYAMELPTSRLCGQLAAYHEAHGITVVNLERLFRTRVTADGEAADLISGMREGSRPKRDGDDDAVSASARPNDGIEAHAPSELGSEQEDAPDPTSKLAERSTDETPANRRFDLRLRMRTRISGRVIDEGTGKPVAGVVEASSRFETNRAVIQPDGTYVFLDLEPGEYRLRPCSHRGEWPPVAVPRLVALDEGARIDDVDFEVERAGTIIVDVTGPDGAPVKKARVSARSLGPNPLHQNPLGPPVPGSEDASSDLEGRYRLVGLPLGHVYRVSVEASGSAPAWKEVKLTRESPALEVAIELERALSIRGRVEHANGTRARGLWVFAQCVGPTEGQARSHPGPLDIKTDEVDDDGNFEIDRISPGRWLVSILPEATRARDDASEVELDVLGSDVEGVVLITLDDPNNGEPRAIAGRVVDDRGEPVSNARVQGTHVDGLARRELSVEPDG